MPHFCKAHNKDFCRMKTARLLLILLPFAIVSGLGGALLLDYLKENSTASAQPFIQESPHRATPASLSAASAAAADFKDAAKSATPSVVFIKGTTAGQANTNDWFWFFGNTGPQTSFGSGVIISADGYIATNNHVVEMADDIEVMINGRNRGYKAKVIGRDPTSDLALLKIEAGQLPAIRFSNSDELQIGEWVLAVGNPYNLTSTVTAGIVSAKGRNISASQSKFSIESFIQTDAAINPGNSGGALVNTAGELVGVNTAIISRTGSYAGYGFAIPSNLAQKILQDLRQYGLVQRAFLEAEVTEISTGLASRLSNDQLQGVQVSYVYENGAAAKAGLKPEDIIISVDGVPVGNQPAYEERLAPAPSG